MGVQLDKDSGLAFKLQDALGGEVAPDLWVPLIKDGADLVRDHHDEEYRTTGQGDSLVESWDPYITFGGPITVPLIPGETYLSSLLSWMAADIASDRNEYNQGKWASVYLKKGRDGREVHASDVKIATAAWRIPANDIVTVQLQLVGLNSAYIAPEADNTPTGLGYKYNEAAVSMGEHGGEVSADANLTNLEFTVDQKLEDAARGTRLEVNSGVPAQLYNLTMPEVRGTFRRDPTNENVYTWFTGRNYVDMQVVLTRGASVLTVMLYRMKFGSGFSHTVGGSGDGRQEDNVPFTCHREATNGRQWYVS